MPAHHITHSHDSTLRITLDMVIRHAGIQDHDNTAAEVQQCVRQLGTTLGFDPGNANVTYRLNVVAEHDHLFRQSPTDPY